MNEAADRSRKAGMEENMKAVFISNYINHHQIPFSNALYEQLGDDYHFIQTEPMEEERIAMGWGLDAATLPYVVWADREEERCRKLIEEADLVFAGWTKRLDLVLPRLSSGKLTFRVSERIYREGQWKAISPKGLLAKYKEHIRFRNPAGVAFVLRRVCGVGFFTDRGLSREKAEIRLFSRDAALSAGGIVCQKEYG